MFGSPFACNVNNGTAELTDFSEGGTLQNPDSNTAMKDSDNQPRGKH
jgi:hypothetical protein